MYSHADREFAAEGGLTPAALLRQLRAACTEAGVDPGSTVVLAKIDAQRLTDRRVIQGVEVTIMGAVYHAIEHFSGHLGQIIYITKLSTGKDLCFWVIGDQGAVERGWTIP